MSTTNRSFDCRRGGLVATDGVREQAMSDRLDAVAKSGTLGKYLRAEQLAEIADRDGAYKREIARLEARLTVWESGAVSFGELGPADPGALREALDVERLARADHNRTPGARCQAFNATIHEWSDHLAGARAVAAEYARLSSATPKDET